MSMIITWGQAHLFAPPRFEGEPPAAPGTSASETTTELSTSPPCRGDGFAGVWIPGLSGELRTRREVVPGTRGGPEQSQVS